MIEWKRSNDGFAESKCGRYRITPLYFSCVKPQSFTLWRGSVRVVYMAGTQREAKQSADDDAARLELAPPPPRREREWKPTPYEHELRVRCACHICRDTKRLTVVGEAYKGRKLDPRKPVEVYRNLHREGVWYSVRQGGRVVAHTRGILLSPARFVVRQAGRERAIREGRRNVHAWVRGRFACSAYGTCVEFEDARIAKGGLGTLGPRIRYDRDRGAFVSDVIAARPAVENAGGVLLNSRGCSYTYEGHGDDA